MAIQVYGVQRGSNIRATFNRAKVTGSLCYIKTDIKSFYNTVVSMSDFQYSTNSGSSFSPGTMSRVEVNGLLLDSSQIGLSGKTKTVDVVWDAGSDLNGYKEFPEVIVRSTWTTSGSGAQSSTFDTDLLYLTFTSSANIPLDKPYPDQDYFTASFKTAVSPVKTRVFYQLLWSTTPTFDSYSVADSLKNQGHWKIGDKNLTTNPYPTTSLDESSSLDVTYTGLDLPNDTTYYFRASRSLHDLF